MESHAFAGQVAFVTGAAGGIGGAVSRALLDRGALVYGADLAAPSPPAGWHGDAARFRPVALDVTRRAAVEAAIAGAAAAAGRLDILVNGAGVLSRGPAATLPEEEWDRVLAVNLKGTFLCCQAAIAPMRARGYGRIVNLGSVVGKNAGNARPWIDAAELSRAASAGYGVSKAGVHALTGFLARELAATGVTVNAVAPGPIATAMTTDFPAALRALIPVGRMGSLDDVAAAVLYLASPAASFITGEVLDINGGMWCD